MTRTMHDGAEMREALLNEAPTHRNRAFGDNTACVTSCLNITHKSSARGVEDSRQPRSSRVHVATRSSHGRGKPDAEFTHLVISGGMKSRHAIGAAKRSAEPNGS